MTAQFLSTFMRLAQQKTGADRALACDAVLNVVDSVRVQATDLSMGDFDGFAALREALSTGEPLITNNLISDPTQAPITNTSFGNLRIVVIIPVQNVGAVYLDRPVRNGVITQKTVERLMLLAEKTARKQEWDVSESVLSERYEQMI